MEPEAHDIKIDDIGEFELAEIAEEQGFFPTLPIHYKEDLPPGLNRWRESYAAMCQTTKMAPVNRKWLDLVLKDLDFVWYHMGLACADWGREKEKNEVGK